MTETYGVEKNHSWTWILYILCFLLGFVSVYAYTLTQNKPTEEIETTQNTPSPGPYQLAPPSRAISGVLKEIQGTVLKFSRNDSDFMESTAGAQILLGESIATKDRSSATIMLSDTLTAAIGEHAELVFSNLFPENTVLQQKSGKIFYSVQSPHPVSIRALHALITASSSAFFINVVDSDIAVTAQSGIVKIALVDANNDTHVWNLEDGSRANIDDEKRKIFFLTSP